MTGPGTASPGQSRRRALTTGVFWVGAFRWTAQILSWAITLVVIRILSPDDYGIVGMTSYFMGLAGVLSDLGLGTAVLALPRLSLEMARQLHALALGAGIAAFLLTLLAAGPMSWYFREPALLPVLLAMGGSFVVDAMRTVPVALLSRGLEYRKASSVDFVRAVASSATVLALALIGARYWSLVGGLLSGSLAATAWALWLRPLGYARPRRSELKGPAAISTHLVVGRLAWQAYQNADFMVAGRLFGAAQLGFYNVGWTIASLPGEKLTTVLTAATAPFFASIRHDAEALRTYFLRLTFLICLLLWPILFGFVLVADLVIPVVLGPKWVPAVPVARALVFYAALQSPMTLSAQILMLTGRTKVSMATSLVALLVLPPVFYLSGKQWGIEGIAWSWAILYPVLYLWPTIVTLKQLGATLGEHLTAMGRAGLLVAVMCAVVLLVRIVLPLQIGIRLELVIAVATGTLSYFLLLAIWTRRDLTLIAEVIRTWRAKEGKPTPSQ
jgi:O-antigen/teichoic acid export membrane protein